jgi:hypothetical protein
MHASGEQKKKRGRKCIRTRSAGADDCVGSSREASLCHALRRMHICMSGSITTVKRKDYLQTLYE